MNRTTIAHGESRLRQMLLATVVGAALVIAGPAMAADDAGGATGQSATGQSTQSQPSNEQPSQEMQKMQTPEQDGAGSQNTATDMRSDSEAPSDTFIATLPNDQLLVERLLGMDVLGAQGEPIGTVRDLTLDRKGAVKSVIISSGGLLGLGDKVVAVPWDSAEMQLNDGVLQTGLTEERIKAAPAFEADAQGGSPFN